jgi:hypothetical protein
MMVPRQITAPLCYLGITDLSAYATGLGEQPITGENCDCSMKSEAAATAIIVISDRAF